MVLGRISICTSNWNGLVKTSTSLASLEACHRQTSRKRYVTITESLFANLFLLWWNKKNHNQKYFLYHFSRVFRLLYLSSSTSSWLEHYINQKHARGLFCVCFRKMMETVNWGGDFFSSSYLFIYVSLCLKDLLSDVISGQFFIVIYFGFLKGICCSSFFIEEVVRIFKKNLSSSFRYNDIFYYNFSVAKEKPRRLGGRVLASGSQDWWRKRFTKDSSCILRWCTFNLSL